MDLQPFVKIGNVVINIARVVEIIDDPGVVKVFMFGDKPGVCHQTVFKGAQADEARKVFAKLMTKLEETPAVAEPTGPKLDS